MSYEVKNPPMYPKHFVDELKAKLEIATEALEFYADFASGKKHQLIFEDETSSRAAVYERYKEYSIGDLGVKALEALQKIKNLS